MRKRYDKEFKTMIAELLLSGQHLHSVAEEYGIHASTARSWKRQYTGEKEAFTGPGNPSLTLEEKEIRRLKKQLREAELERDGCTRILKKAVGIFSASDRKGMGS